MKRQRVLGAVKVPPPASVPSAPAKRVRVLGAAKAPAPLPDYVPGAPISRCRGGEQGCRGYWLKQHWYHDKGCPFISVIWSGAREVEADWACPYRCPPHRLPDGITHQWNCEYWDHTLDTPF